MMKKILKALPVAFVIFLLMGSACGASVVNEKVDGSIKKPQNYGFIIYNHYDSYFDFGDIIKHNDGIEYDDEVVKYDDDTDIKFNDNEKSVWL